MAENHLKRRKQFLIDRKVQGSLAIRLAMHWLLLLVLTLTLNFGLRFVGNVDESSLIDVAATAFRDQAAAMLVLLALLPWFIKDALQLSHRFVGPVFRMRSALRQLADGEELQPVVFRRGDFFRDVADDINRLGSKLAQERKELQRARMMQASEVECAATIELPVVFDATSSNSHC